jgi:hypothetical protein
MGLINKKHVSRLPATGWGSKLSRFVAAHRPSRAPVTLPRVAFLDGEDQDARSGERGPAFSNSAPEKPLPASHVLPSSGNAAKISTQLIDRKR